MLYEFLEGGPLTFVVFPEGYLTSKWTKTLVWLCMRPEVVFEQRACAGDGLLDRMQVEPRACLKQMKLFSLIFVKHTIPRFGSSGAQPCQKQGPSPLQQTFCKAHFTALE